jgi:hypothetical protein
LSQHVRLRRSARRRSKARRSMPGENSSSNFVRSLGLLARSSASSSSSSCPLVSSRSASCSATPGRKRHPATRRDTVTPHLICVANRVPHTGPDVRSPNAKRTRVRQAGVRASAPRGRQSVISASMRRIRLPKVAARGVLARPFGAQRPCYRARCGVPTRGFARFAADAPVRPRPDRFVDLIPRLFKSARLRSTGTRSSSRDTTRCAPA